MVYLLETRTLPIDNWLGKKLIWGFARVGDLPRCFDVLGRLHETGCGVDLETYEQAMVVSSHMLTFMENRLYRNVIFAGGFFNLQALPRWMLVYPRNLLDQASCNDDCRGLI